MTTHALTHTGARSPTATTAATHWLWLLGGLVVGFLIPFVLADTLELNRDVYYGIYAVVVGAFLGTWVHTTHQSLRALVSRRLGLAVALGVAAAAVLAVMVYRTEDATSRPDGVELVAAIVWRGVLYGVVDGLLLSAFPILVVFAAFAGSKLRRRSGGIVLVALAALAASLAMTAVYHAGYSEFRGEKLRKPVAGDVVWSAPTLLTLNPVGAPIAHVGLHTSAVLHSYETDTFLPPHPAD
jgi:hypothetical protein